jgi:hypothetical protein
MTGARYVIVNYYGSQYITPTRATLSSTANTRRAFVKVATTSGERKDYGSKIKRSKKYPHQSSDASRNKENRCKISDGILWRRECLFTQGNHETYTGTQQMEIKKRYYEDARTGDTLVFTEKQQMAELRDAGLLDFYLINKKLWEDNGHELSAIEWKHNYEQTKRLLYAVPTMQKRNLDGTDERHDHNVA